MPEGDTIYRSAVTLKKALAGHAVTGFRTVLAQLARIDDDTPIAGRTIDDVTSRGKHILIAFSGDLVLRTHMRMNGSWHLYRPGERWRAAARDMRIVIATASFEAVAFRVPVAEFRTAATLERDQVIQALGPDLLDPAADLGEAARRLRALDAMPLADALLNQHAVAGIGNVFKSEICFEAGLSPTTPIRALDDTTLDRVLTIARRQLRANVLDGRAGALSAWRGGRRTTGRANPSAGLWVYGRAGAPCRTCGTPIARAPQGPDARLTYYCPRCQPDGGN
jgi:endonuclease VIII